MIPWIIVSVIVLLVFFFFISKPTERKVENRSYPNYQKKNRDMELADDSELEKYVEMDISEFKNDVGENGGNSMPLRNKRLNRKFFKKTFKNKRDLELSNEIITEKSTDFVFLSYDPEFKPDHVINIGERPKHLSGHEMPIDMQLSPMFLAMAKDPYWVFLTWVLPEDYTRGDYEIKVNNLTRNTSFFKSVNPEAKNWYLFLNQPDNLFSFELGFRDENGFFKPILFSNLVQTPRDRPSNFIDEDWVAIDEFYQKKTIFNHEGSPEFIIESQRKVGASENLIK